MKSIFQSKVFWLAVVQAIIGAVGIFSNAYPGVGYLILLKSVLDVMFRFLTSEPVSITGN